MEINETFLDDLEITFQGRLRARWSAKQRAIIIEQRTARSLIGSVPRRAYDNETRQSLAEGYKLLMTVAPRETIRCARCNYTLEVPKLETREITCLQCKLSGLRGKVFAGYYPLNSSLIHYLKSIDPLRDNNESNASKMVEYNENITKQQQRQLFNASEAYADDNFNRIVGIQQVGRTKVMAGTELKGF